MRTHLGCLSPLGISAAIATLLIVSGVVLLQGGMIFSPGPLNAVPGKSPLGGFTSHAEIGGNCAACHAAPWAPAGMGERCASCHTEIALGLDDPQTLHGAMVNNRNPFRCQLCHTEHAGPEAVLTVMFPEDFPHHVIGFSLQGHQASPDTDPVTCADCHPENFTEFQITACESCHRDLTTAYMESHMGVFGAECLACHDGVDSYGGEFSHNLLAFPLQGEHVKSDCETCHEGARSKSDLQSAPNDCYACHAGDDTHQGSQGTNCAVCHTPESWSQSVFDHSKTAFPLLGAHAQSDCEGCHQSEVPTGTPQDCFACHAVDDAHRGTLGADCATCHTAEGWTPADFDHSQTTFPLVGEHTTAACQDCHESAVFAGAPRNCFACHELDDQHEGRFGKDCAACHTPEGWTPAGFDHDLSDFPLTGAHEPQDCVQCHTNEVFAGTPTTCAACHEDPTYHAGLFDPECTACHNTTAWLPATYERTHTFPFDHGEKGVNACRTCHPSSLGGYTCTTCHERAETDEKHREEGISDYADCTRCHPTGREHEGEGED